MKKKVLTIALISLFIAGCGTASEQKNIAEKRETNEKKIDLNTAKEISFLTGDWSINSKGLLQNKNTEGHYIALYKNPVSDNTVITLEGTPTAKNNLGYGSIGIVCKYLDKDNYVSVRFGAYEAFSAQIMLNGKKKIINFNQKIKLETGKNYKFKAELTQGLFIIKSGNETLGIFRDPFKGKEGYTGLFAMSPAEFHSLSISEAKTDISGLDSGNKEFVDVLKESNIWKLEGLEYATAPLSRTANYTVSYPSIAVYLRNKSSSPVSVSDVSIDGIPVEKLISSGKVAWWRAWPATVMPGTVTQLLIKMSDIGERRTLQTMLGLPGDAYNISVRTKNDDNPLEIKFAIAPKQPSLRINFIAFDEKLKTLHVYVSANDNLIGKELEKVEVNGIDLTKESSLKLKGGNLLKADSLPIRIDLKNALVLGEPTVVRVCSGNITAGHAVRTFPSTFPVQLVILGSYPETTAIDEIANLCFSDVGFCGAGNKTNMYLSEMKKKQLLYFPYTGCPNATKIEEIASCKDRPPVSGWWLDEVDKPDRKTPYEVQQTLRQTDAVLTNKNIPLAPYCMNLCSPSDDKGYIELADALSHEYGIDHGIRGVLPQIDFKDPQDILSRELRISRRPWWPYFRNIEAVLLISPETKETVSYFRPIDPREHRLIVYSCLANGAKGALNWNYGLNYFTPKQLTWLSDKYNAIRLNMTALKKNEAYGKIIPEYLLEALQNATNECGRVNAELNLLGPLLAMGDLSDAAIVNHSKPENNPRGGPAVHTRAIYCGMDTIIVFIVNLNIDSDFNARKGKTVRAYNPVSASVNVNIPPWLGKEKDVFEVSWRGISSINSKQKENKMNFDIPVLAVSKAIVITSDMKLKKQMMENLHLLRKKLADAGVSME